MRITLDTNVLVSGLLKGHSAAGTIVRLIAGGLVQVVYDARIPVSTGKFWRARSSVLNRPL
jgi:predicted nucleic acid-binding protein